MVRVEHRHLIREQYETFEDSVEINPGCTWDSIHLNSNLSSRLIVTVCAHYDTTVTDSKGYKSWLPTRERRMQD